MMGLIAASKDLQTYGARLAERPAFQRANAD
jgi:hypothetical protein